MNKNTCNHYEDMECVYNRIASGQVWSLSPELVSRCFLCTMTSSSGTPSQPEHRRILIVEVAKSFKSDGQYSHAHQLVSVVLPAVTSSSHLDTYTQHTVIPSHFCSSCPLTFHI